MNICPDLGSQKRISSDAVVDFPQPDMPTSATTEPFGISSDTSLSARLRPS